MLLFYVIPVTSILGKLSLVQTGDTGTIPFDPTSKSQADFDALSDKYYPGDTEPGSGNDCRLWHTNRLVSGHVSSTGSS